VAYVRTYDVALAPARSDASSLEAVVRHARAFGPLVRLELELVEGGRMIDAHIPRAQFDGQALGKGHRVYVSPTNVRVFAQPS
jgi:ABC-type sulfate/molybdate transport systems ATPase subunit